jgi:hypothetical protein
MIIFEKTVRPNNISYVKIVLEFVTVYYSFRESTSAPPHYKLFKPSCDKFKIECHSGSSVTSQF